MEKELILGKGSDAVKLQQCEKVVSVSVLPQPIGERIFLSAILILMLALLVLAISAVIATALVAILDKDLLALLLFVVFSSGTIPVVLVNLKLQSSLFRFEASFDTATGKYQLSNGVLRFSVGFNPETVVIRIYPAHSRGDWGYTAKVYSEKRKFGLPFIPAGVIGGKKAAFREAVKIRDWLSQCGIASETVSWEQIKFLGKAQD